MTLPVIAKTSNPVPECINATDASDITFVMNDPVAAWKYPNSMIHHWGNSMDTCGNLLFHSVNACGGLSPRLRHIEPSRVVWLTTGHTKLRLRLYVSEYADFAKELEM
jgi:hypothetical protein